MTLKFNRVHAVVNLHVRAKYHQAECSDSWLIVLTNFFALSRNGIEFKTLSCDLNLWPWNSTGFVRLSRYTFLQNFIKLSERLLSYCADREKKTPTKKITPSIPRGITYNSPRESLVPEARSFFETEEHSTDRCPECCGHTSGGAARHKVTLLRVRPEVLKQLLTASHGFRLHTCVGMRKTGIQRVPWDSHGNGNTISHGMGMGMRCMGIGIKKLEWECE